VWMMGMRTRRPMPQTGHRRRSGASALPSSSAARTALVMVFAVVFGLGETLMAPTLTPLVNALVPDELMGRANAVAGGMFAFAFLVSPAIVTAFIAAGAAGGWIALMAIGALAVSLLSLGLGRRLGPEQNIGEPELPPEPVPEPTAY